MGPNMKEKKLLKVTEAARVLSISRSKAYELVASGDLPVIHLGPRCVRVPIEALDRWIENSRKK